MSAKENLKSVEKKKVEIIETRDMKIKEDIPPNFLRDYKVVVHKKRDSKN